MRQEKKRGRRLLSLMLALVMVFSTLTGIVPGTSLTAHAMPEEIIKATVVPEDAGTAVGKAVGYQYQFTATANPGYEFRKYTYTSGNKEMESTANTLVLDEGNTNNVKAVFDYVDSGIIFTFNITGEGNIKISKDSNNPSTYNYEVNPSEGYELKDITATLSEVNEEKGTITVPNNITSVEITAEFAEIAEEDKYDLYIGGVQVNASNKDKDHTWSYDPDTNTLTLKGYTYTESRTDAADNIYAIEYRNEKSLTIILEGDNSITGDGNTKLTGVKSKGDLTFKGDGSLKIKTWGTSISGSQIDFEGGSVDATSTNAASIAGDYIYISEEAKNVIAQINSESTIEQVFAISCTGLDTKLFGKGGAKSNEARIINEDDGNLKSSLQQGDLNYKYLKFSSEHVHVFKNATFKAIPDGSTIKITAECEGDTDFANCDFANEGGATILTIKAPENAVYNGTRIPVILKWDSSLSKEDKEKITTTIKYKKVDGAAGEETAEAPSDAGDYEATVSFSVDGNTLQGSLRYTINKREVTVSVKEGLSKYYGEEDPKFEVNINGLINYTDDIKYTISRQTGEDAGEYTVTPSGLRSQGNYIVNYESRTLNIKRLPVVVVPNDSQSKKYGASDPEEFEWKVYQYKNNERGEELSDLKDSLQVKTERESGEAVGRYTIKTSGSLTQDNYNVSYNTGIFTIENSDSAKYKLTYNGDAQDLIGATDRQKEPEMKYAILEQGEQGEPGENDWKPADDESLKKKDAGRYYVWYKKSGTESGTENKYYDVVEINPAPIKIIAADEKKTYGDEADTGEWTWTAEGLAKNDRANYKEVLKGNGITLESDGTNKDADVDEYKITVKVAEKKAGNYYVANQESGILTVEQKQLTAVEPKAAEDWTYDGKSHELIIKEEPDDTNDNQNDDNTGEATGEVTVDTEPKTIMKYLVKYNENINQEEAANIPEGTWSSDIPEGEAAGTYYVWYKVVPDENNNYCDSEPDFVTVTINKAEVTVTPEDKEKIYDEDDPKLTWKATGLVDDEPVTLLDKVQITRESGEDIGEYAIIVHGDEDQGNYHVTYDKDAKLTINKRPVTVDVKAIDKVYDGNNTATIDVAKAVFKDNAGKECDLGKISSYDAKFDNANVGDNKTVTITNIECNGENADNYSIPETITVKANITARELIVTATNALKPFGDKDPELTYTCKGIVDTDKEADVLTGQLTRVPGENIGEYDILQGTVKANANYTITYNGAKLEITNGAISPVVSVQGWTYGSYKKETNAPQVTGNSGNGNVTYFYTDKVLEDEEKEKTVWKDWVDEDIEKLPAGTYYVYAKVEKVDGYKEAATEPSEFTVAKKKVGVEWNSTSLDYNGKPQKPTATVADKDILEGDVVEIEVSGEKIDVGSYTATASKLTGTNADSYELSTATTTFTINKVAAVVKTSPAANALTYNGQSQELVKAGEAEGGKLLYALGTEAEPDAKEYKETIPSAKDAESYIVWYKVIADGNHTDTKAANVKVSIAKKIVAVTPDEGQNKVFGESDPAFTFTSEGLVDGEELTAALTRANGENAGEYAYSIDDAKSVNANYSLKLAENASKFEIIKAAQASLAEKLSTSNAGENDKTDGKITGLDASKSYQYSADEGKTWIDVKAGSTEIAVKSGTYQIRYAEDNNHVVGEAVKVTVNKDEPVVTPAEEEQAAKEAAAININAGLKISQTGSKLNIKWGKISEADGYDVYVTYCGKKYGNAAKTIKKNSTTSAKITKINGKKLNLKKNYKVYIAAYKMVDGKKEIIARTIEGHVVGRKNTKYSNAKDITLSKSAYSIKVGKTATVKAKTVLVDKSKKQLSKAHAAEFRYATSDKKIATVDKNGKIKGVAKGTCTVYVYARNGYAKTVNVTVK